ncbi:TIGR04282 family arsenosugar biosynthesis glycosyltransferase [Mucilaginibacter sp. UYCu711]|uniref:TIGR04282 family arsenosugar biosynthesis glycosyltransferase n=1 Tax=Mucilaginibacter sp. UYCu711 TaxID=3156339 RepID=UPI003D22F230
MSTVTPLNTALIIFVRHPELGKVKTRLAKVIGDEKALEVYKLLLQHTRQITLPLNCRKFIYYADGVPEHDSWTDPGYTKRQQFGNDLGQRMANAFGELFEQGFKRVLIIGSDCYQLRTAILDDAIALLNGHHAVVGPTFDGGYYLLGMNHFIPELFKDKAWSTDQVYQQTIKDLNDLSQSFIMLDKLHDVDEAADLEVNGITI